MSGTVPNARDRKMNKILKTVKKSWVVMVSIVPLKYNQSTKEGGLNSGLGFRIRKAPLEVF